MSSGRRFRAVCAAIFLLLPAMLFAAGVRGGNDENRRGARAPSWSDGFSMAAVASDWAADSVPLRQQMIQAARWIDRTLFGGSGTLAPASGPGVAGVAGATPTIPSWPYPAYPQVLTGADGTLFYGGDFAQLCEPVLTASQISDALGDLARAIRASGRTFVVVVAPDKSQVLSDRLPEGPEGADCRAERVEAIDEILRALPYYVDVGPALDRLAASTDVYLRTDSHWDGPAAATMVRAVVRHLDPSVTPSMTWRPQPSLAVVGDLSRLAGAPQQERYQPVLVAAPGVRHAWTGVSTIDGTPRRYVSVGPADAQIGGRSLWLGDSFTLASGATVPQMFTDLTQLHVSTARSDTDTLVREVVSADTVVLALAQRDLYSGAAPILARDVVDAVVSALERSPR